MHKSKDRVDIRTRIATLLALLLLPAAVQCADRGYEPVVLEQGRTVFRDHCAVCHGPNAEGTVSNWQQRDTSGRLPPPPLNGTAHAWHHPATGLATTIKNGTGSIGGNMPAFGHVLNDDEVFAVILWLSSLWPEPLYQDWLQRSLN